MTLALSVLLACSMHVAATDARASGLAFGPASTYQVGTYPQTIVVGDFDADGTDDLAVANGGSATVSILMGRGDGTFATAVDYPSADPTDPQAYLAAYLAAGDFNADTHLDLAIGTGWILLGSGDGTFTRGVDQIVAAGPLLSADFDKDGQADLAVTIYRIIGLGRYNAISVLLGNGDGTFQTGIEQPVVCCSAGGGYIASNDFDRDGNLDLVLSQSARGPILSLLLGNGDGTFTTSALPANGGSYGVSSADFNLDGDPDLAVAAGYVGAVSIQLGNGDGTFGTQTFYQVGPEGTFPVGTQTGDFDGDGRPDVAVGKDSSVSVLFGLGDGTFMPPLDQPVGVGPDFIVSANFNNDGTDDLAVANGGDGTISVVLGVPFDVAAALASLRNNVAGMGLPKGLATSLGVQLDRAAFASQSGSGTGPCRFLANFMREVRIQSGRQLTVDQADKLMATARWIGVHLACG